MQDETDRFWKDLQAKVNQGSPGSTDDLSMEEAERRMAEAGEEPFSGDEIDKMVRSAVGEGGSGLRVVGGDQVAKKRGLLLRFRGWAQAAAVVLGLLILYAVGTRGGSIPPKRIGDFASAVSQLLDVQLDSTTRGAAQGVVYSSARASIGRLRDVRQQESGGLQVGAADHLEELSQVLRDEERPSPATIARLVEGLPDLGDSPPETVAELDAHATQIRFAIWTLKAVPLEEASDLDLNRDDLLRFLERLLDA